MVDAMTIIPNSEYRQRFHDFAHRYQINKTNVFATIATETAYRHGEKWLEELMDYLQDNISFIQSFLEEASIPVSLLKPQGTFLAWLDFRELGLDAKELQRFLAQEANIAITPGYWFGREGAGFARMTIGVPRSTLKRALDNLTAAHDGRH
jgi:cystathionine beta-lyase